MNAKFSRKLAPTLALPLILSTFVPAPFARAAQATAGCPQRSDARRGTISGTIADPSGARVRDARVVVECGDFREETRSATDGTFSLSVPPGSATLRVDAAGFDAASRDVVVTDGASLELALALALAPVQTVVTVTDDGYAAERATSGTKTDTPLLRVPQAISVVKEQLLEDQGAVKLDDALKNVAGVMPGGYYQDWDYYRIRGFDAAFTTYVNGLRGNDGMGAEVYGLERVEVIKGPASAVYGQGSLGGIVNLQSKRPRRDAFAELELTGGSYGFFSPALDMGGSLNDAGTVYGRFTALYRKQDSFVDFVGKERIYVAPALTWEIGNATTLTFLNRYERDYNRIAFPLPAAGTVSPNVNGEIPIERYVGEPGSNLIEQSRIHLGYQFDHRFGENFTLRQNFNRSWYDDSWNSFLYPALLADDQRTLYRYPYSQDYVWNNLGVDQSLESKFETGRLRHNLLTGFEYYRRADDYHYQIVNFDDFSQFSPIDLFAPAYGNQPVAVEPWIDGGESFTRSAGFYVQDQVRLTERLTLTAGGRLELASMGNEFDPVDQDDRAFTPRLGVSYEFADRAVVYGNYSRSFSQQFGRVFDGSASGAFVEPERGVQWEAGLKAGLWDGRLNATLAAFNLTRENVTTNDPLHPNFLLVTGEQRTRGVELETSTRLTDRWLMTAAYTLTEAEVTRDSDIPVGTRIQNVPRHSVNVWTTYELPREWIDGLGVGFGGRHYSDQGGDLFDTFSLPSYGLLDAAVTYRRGRLRGQVNFYNLTDERYFTGSYDILYVQPGDPRTVRATVGWTF